ncbi:MAG: hypothetical protein GY714_14425 [Desulfobacterales bacterium]|nr:hypothetical protein [Desulfobacterales bacterium]
MLNIDIKKKLQPAYDIFVSEQQESKDLRILSNLRFEGILIQGKKTMVSSFYSWDEVILKSLIRESGKLKGISNNCSFGKILCYFQKKL